MKTLHRRCAGLDVHSNSVVACARLTVRTRATHEVRRFSTARPAYLVRDNDGAYGQPRNGNPLRMATTIASMAGIGSTASCWLISTVSIAVLWREGDRQGFQGTQAQVVLPLGLL